MLVHVSEGSMDQERAREPTHGLRGWQPCLTVTYVYEGGHVPSRHVIPLLILSTASGYVTDVSPADRPRKHIPTDKTSFPSLLGLAKHVGNDRAERSHARALHSTRECTAEPP